MRPDFSPTSNFSTDYQKRVELATSCSDCDALPKVPDAGNTFGEANQLQLMHNGLVIRRGAYHGEWMTEIIRRLRGHHEPQEEKVFAAVLEHLPESATMIELGSFWAYYSMWFHLKVKKPTCILVEPISEKLAVGQEHFRLNGMTGTFINAFVGREPGQNAEFRDWDGSRLNVPRISVDGLMKDLKLENVDILHADVQGAEFDMLRGAEHALRSQSIKYFFYFNPWLRTPGLFELFDCIRLPDYCSTLRPRKFFRRRPYRCACRRLCRTDIR